jgi:hypothetical protein
LVDAYTHTPIHHTYAHTRTTHTPACTCTHTLTHIYTRLAWGSNYVQRVKDNLDFFIFPLFFRILEFKVNYARQVNDNVQKKKIATQLELKSNYVQRVKDNLNFGTELSVRTRPPPEKLKP